MTNTIGTTRLEVVAAARELSRAARWERALALLDATSGGDPEDRAHLAVAAAEVAHEAEYSGSGSGQALQRLEAAEELCSTVDIGPAAGWDLAFLRLRRGYFDLLSRGTALEFGPHGKDPEAIDAAERAAEELRDRAPDEIRRGWAHFYLGVIIDNLRGDRKSAPAHYELALGAGESGDDLLTWEALRHLGDHDHDDGDHDRARERWERATALGAAAGAVLRTLSQQMLLAVLARDSGDEAGATALAREIARWAGAIGVARIEVQAKDFLAGIDPTAPPPSVKAA